MATMEPKPYYYVPYSSALKTFTSKEIIYTDNMLKEPLKQRSNGNASELPEPSTLKAINIYIRQHPFLQISLGSFTTSQRRSFERDVYDYSRSLSLSRSHAKIEIRKARRICGETVEDSDQSALDGEVDDSLKIKEELLGKMKGGPSNGDRAVTNVSSGALEKKIRERSCERGDSIDRKKTNATESLDISMMNGRQKLIENRDNMTGGAKESSKTSKRKRSKTVESEFFQKDRKKRKENKDANLVSIGEHPQCESTVVPSSIQNDLDATPVHTEGFSLNKPSERKGTEKEKAQKRKKTKAENAKAAKRAKDLDASATEENTQGHEVRLEISDTGAKDKIETPAAKSDERADAPLENAIEMPDITESHTELARPMTGPPLEPNEQVQSHTQMQSGGSEDGELIQIEKPPSHPRLSRKHSKSPTRILNQSSLQSQPLSDEHGPPPPNITNDVLEGEKPVKGTGREDVDLTSKETVPIIAGPEMPEKPKKRNKSKKKAVEAEKTIEEQSARDSNRQPFIVVDHLASLLESTAPLRKSKKPRKSDKTKDNAESDKKHIHEKKGQSQEGLSLQHQDFLKDERENQSDKPKKGRKRKALAGNEEETSTIEKGPAEATSTEKVLDDHGLVNNEKDEQVMERGEQIMETKSSSEPKKSKIRKYKSSVDGEEEADTVENVLGEFTATEKMSDEQALEMNEQIMESKSSSESKKSKKRKGKSSVDKTVISEQEEQTHGATENTDFQSLMI